MKLITKILFAPIIVAFFSFGIYIVPWEIKDDYTIAFDTKGASGTIAGLQGTIDFSPNTLNKSQINISLDVNTLDAGSSLKTKHAINESFLNAEKYPKITFKSSSFAKTSSGYDVKGDLTIKGTTKAVEIPFIFTQKGPAGEFNGNFQINREDYKLEKWGIGKVLAIAIKLPVTQ